MAEDGDQNMQVFVGTVSDRLEQHICFVPSPQQCRNSDSIAL